MSGIASAMAAMNYIQATKRHGCRDCIHGEEARPERMPPWDKPYWQCNKGGFRTSAMAICAYHQPRTAAPVLMPSLPAATLAPEA